MSAAFDAQSSKEANAKQQAKYPDISAEMRRRAALRKTRSGGKGTFAENSRRAKLGWEKRRAKAEQAPESQDFLEDQDQAGYIENLTSQD